MNDDAARRAPACSLVIFGASGDLTERKLLPAIRQLAAHHRLRREFALIGVARTAMSDEEWADKCLSGGAAGAGEWAPKASFRYISGGYDDPDTYHRLGEVLADCDRALGTVGQHVFYLATPPRLFGTIAVQLGRSSLNVSAAGDWPRLVIEKPFGWDEASARSLYADMKGSVALDSIGAAALADYAAVTGHLLAKGHARTSGASMIVGYAGSSDRLDTALARFARLYADQTEADHAALVKAADRGIVPIERGL